MWDEYGRVSIFGVARHIHSLMILYRLIAIMLGRLEMSVDECIEAFTSMMDIIFVRSHRLPFKWTNGKVQARYDTKALERCIANVIQEAGYGGSKMRVANPTCKTYVFVSDEKDLINTITVSSSPCLPKPSHPSTSPTTTKTVNPLCTTA
jgi:hypothetical protein